MDRQIPVREHERRKRSGGMTQVREHEREASDRQASLQKPLEKRYRSTILVDVDPGNPRRYKVKLRVSNGVSKSMDFLPEPGANRNQELEETIEGFRNELRMTRNIEPIIRWTPEAKALYASLGGHRRIEEKHGIGRGTVEYAGEMPTNICLMKEYIDRIAWEMSRERGSITFGGMLEELEDRHGKDEVEDSINLIADAFEEHVESRRFMQVGDDEFLHMGYLDSYYVYGHD